MIPKKIPVYVLLLIWVAGTLPYFTIEFWLSNVLPLFHGADKVGKFVADSSLAFSTAFPFWFVTEWFSRRGRRSEIARIQRTFIDKCVDDFNRYFNFMLTGGSKEFLPAIPNYAYTISDEELRQWVTGFVDHRLAEMRQRLSAVTENDARVIGELPSFNIIWNIQQMEKRFALIEPYQGDFSFEFNGELQWLAQQCADIDRLNKDYPRGDENRLPFMVSAYTGVRYHLLRLENQFRMEHRTGPKVAHPNGRDYE